MGDDDHVTQLLMLPGHLIDEEIAAIEKAMREGGASPSRLSGITTRNKELRERLQINIIESLLSFIYSVGKAFFTLEAKKGHARGASYVLTAQKVFLPDVANALIDPHRTRPLCPLLPPDVFLPHAYEWYVRGVAAIPGRFRTDEWELYVDEAGELIVRLTAEEEEKSARPKRERAKVVRMRFGIRDDDPPKK